MLNTSVPFGALSIGQFRSLLNPRVTEPLGLLRTGKNAVHSQKSALEM